MRKHILLFFLSCFTIAFAYSQQYEFSHLDNNRGLSNNQIESIFRDSRGFLWIGTNMGFNRYDGTNIKIYRNIKNDKSSPIHNKIMGMQEDTNGNIWLRSISYMVYDWRNESFINNTDSLLKEMQLPPNPSIIEIDKDKNFLVAYDSGGILKYNIKSKNITRYKQSGSNNDLDLSNIIQIKTQDRFIWILHANGVLERINIETGMVDLRNVYFKENAQNSTIPKKIFVDRDNDIWIYPGIEDKGTACLNRNSNKWTQFTTNSKIALSNDFVRCIDQDSEGKIWICIDHGGVNIFDKKEQTISIIKNDRYNPNSIRQNSTISLLCEDDGTVWIGTYKNGLSYYHPNMFKFKKTPLFYLFSQNAEVFDCNSIYKDQSQNLWIGTNGSGLVKYNAESGHIERFRHDPNDEKSISSDIITAIIKDHGQTLWIGTFLGGLNAYDGKSFKRFRMDESNSNSLSNRSIYGLAEDDNKNIWIATLGSGIDRLDTSRKTFTHYNINNSPLQTNYILSIFSDTSKNLFFGSDMGIYVVKQNQNNITPFFTEQSLLDSLTTPATNYQITDARGLLWIATDEGVNIYNPITRHFEYITVRQGLPCNEVVSLVEDNKGNIWAGTRNGLACIFCQYADQALTYTIVSFDTNDGLPSLIFNPNAIFKDNDGIIYMGSTGGYIAFDPDEIVFNRKAPTPRFTNLYITNQEIQPNREYNGRVIIHKTISDLKEIKLKHGETNFSIHFSALNYVHPEKSKYKYKLEGLDKQWTETHNGTGIVSYSNLNPGTYELVAYASNEDNVWSAEPISLKIIIEPPFWLSWWAYIIYLSIIGLLIRLFLKYKLNKQKEVYKQAQILLEAKKIHEIDELKFKFFTNISHEFKTPLSLILSPLEKLIKSPVYNDYKSILDIMNKNANNLLNMVNEILDFRKFDLNKMALNISRGNIIEFTKDVCLSFSSMASEKSVELIFTSYLQELQMDFDKEKMQKIITNLISNAFKYTEEGNITISIGIQEQPHPEKETSPALMSLKVSDTGSGIEAQYLDKIFERFFRIENNEKYNQPGTGVGLHLVSEYVKLHRGTIQVESTEGKGTVFTVLFPIQSYILTGMENTYPINSKSQALPDKEVASPQKTSHSNMPALMIIDDNEDFCNFITELFVEDYHIITADDGEEGYNIILDQLPDIILCDVMMPKMDGYELCQKAKNDMRISHIPIILLTAKSSEENKYLGIESGADDYISKPFNIDMLKLKITKIIEKQKKLQNVFKKKIDISVNDTQIMSMDEKFVQKAVSIVEENISNSDFLVEDLCKEMAMSRVYFYKKILALTDKTPSEFVRFIRLKRAAELLVKSQMFVNEIAFQVGFNEPKYFRKYFKEEFGITPNEYKKSVSK